MFDPRATLLGTRIADSLPTEEVATITSPHSDHNDTLSTVQSQDGIASWAPMTTLVRALLTPAEPAQRAAEAYRTTAVHSPQSIHQYILGALTYPDRDATLAAARVLLPCGGFDPDKSIYFDPMWRTGQTSAIPK